ncbi:MULTISPECIES: DMT family transporter [Emticicia]|uniref:DMT family transporter n=1 Tax=Emticicia TaxID=312278 RepID=UPI0007D8B5D8|nr:MULTISPECIES: DMT family transporter [Emticicia]
MPKRSNYWLGALLVFGAAFGFALKGIFIKSAYQYGVDTISLLSLRFIFAAPFYIFTILRKRFKEEAHPKVSTSTWLKLFGVGFIGYYISAYFNLLGLNYITASLERILLFVYPTFVLILSAIIFKKKITPLQWLALGITYFGIFIAFLKNFDAHQQKDIWLGAFWVILSGFTYAFYLISSDGLIAKLGTTRFTSWVILSAFVPTLIHCYTVNQLNILNFPIPVYTISLSMAVFSTVLPTFMLSEGIKRVGSGNASIIASIGPIFTIVLATTFLGETIWLEQIIGTVFVLIGVFLISWKGKK